MDEGRFEDARRNLHRAYELFPSADVAFALTQFWVRIGNYESALAWLERTQEHELAKRSRLRPDLSKSFEEKKAALHRAAEQQRKSPRNDPANTGDVVGSVSSEVTIHDAGT